tara:strand:- start:1660 stop:2295 length:636 start_codon:yes stop_codon:yes gene_type:complete
MVLDPATWGTAIGAHIGGAPGAGAGKALGNMIPGYDLGPEDDNFRSNLEGGFEEVTGDFVRGAGQQQMGEFIGDEVGGMFADPVAVDTAGGGAGYAGGYPQDHFQLDAGVTPGGGGIDPKAFGASASQEAANAPTTAAMDPNKLSTLEKAYMLNSIVQTGFNMVGDMQDRRRYDESRGPGNPFDRAMTDAFSQNQRSQGVETYQNYLKRVG